MSFEPKHSEDRPDKLRYTEYDIDGEKHLRIFFPNTAINFVYNCLTFDYELYTALSDSRLVWNASQGVVALPPGNGIMWAWKFFCDDRNRQ